MYLMFFAGRHLRYQRKFINSFLIEPCVMQKQNIFTILLFIFLFALPAHASDCARMERKWPWEPGQEVKYECNKIAKMTLSWIKKDELPDIQQLLQADIISSESILGQPFHCYEYNEEKVCFFQEDAPIIIGYNKNNGKPNTILFNLIQVESVESIPEILGLGLSSTPMKGPAGPFWNNLNGVKQLECHNPEFKYAGNWIYPIIIHIDKAPISTELMR